MCVCACVCVCVCAELVGTVYIHSVYDRIFGDFPAQNTVHTTYIYGSGQPYMCGLWVQALVRLKGMQVFIWQPLRGVLLYACHCEGDRSVT